MNEKVKDWFVNNLLTILTIVGPPTVTLVGKLWLAKDTAPTFFGLTAFELLLIAVVILDALILFVKAVYDRCHYRAYHYPKAKINIGCWYTVLNKTITYKMTEQNELHYSRSLTIRSESGEEHRAIYDKFLWTGVSKAEFPKPVKVDDMDTISEILPSNVVGVWNYFQIAFSTRLYNRQILKLKYAWPPIPNCNHSSPFAAASTDEPTKELSLSVDLGPRYAGHKILLEEYRAIESDCILSSKRVDLNDRGCYTWDKNTGLKPQRFRHYRIRWTWDDSDIQPVPSSKE